MRDTDDQAIQTIIDDLRASKRRVIRPARNRVKRVGRAVGFTPRGQARLRLVDQRVVKEVSRSCEGASYEERRSAVLARGVELDTGWSKNTVTDFARLRLANNSTFGTQFDVFIHEGTNPSNVRRQSLQFIYANQTPPQIRTPDTFVANETLLLQTWTVQFPAPSVARDINIVGLTGDTFVSTGENAIHEIMAYTLLSSTVQQSVVQVADVQYRVTWALEA